VKNRFQSLPFKCNLQVVNAVEDHSLKAPGFNPWNLKCDILASKFAFSNRVNLYRYITVLQHRTEEALDALRLLQTAVGLCTLDQLDP
jgi:hypothetical protein